MIVPLIPPRLHAWLDEAVVLVYLIGAFILKLGSVAMTIAMAGAAVHFFLTRFTANSQGFVKVIPFRVHAWIELAEGLGVLLATFILGPGRIPGQHQLFLGLLGLSQLVAFSFSDYRSEPATPVKGSAGGTT